jgi:hypothetical protein
MPGVSIVGNVTYAILGSTLLSGSITKPKVVFKGGEVRNNYPSSNYPVTGITGNVSVTNTANKQLVLELDRCGVDGTLTLSATPSACTMLLFVNESSITGTTSASSGSQISLYANNCNSSSSNSIGALSGQVLLNILYNVTFAGIITNTTASSNSGSWYNVQFKSGANDHTGTTNTPKADANSIKSYYDNFAAGATRGTFTPTLVDDAQGVGFTPSVSGNWTSVPTTVQGGLDNLASEKQATLPSATAGDYLTYDGSAWVAGSPTVGAGQAITYFLDPATTVDAALKIQPTPSSSGESTSNVVVNNSSALLKRFVSTTALGGTSIEAGIWEFDTFCSNSGTTNTTYITQRVDRRVTGTRTATISGATPFVSGDANSDIKLATYLETPTVILQISGYTSSSVVTVTCDSGYSNESAAAYKLHYRLFGADTDDLNNTSVQLVTTTSVQQAHSINNTDTLVFTYFATTAATANRTVTLYYAGSTNYSHAHVPLLYRHNNLPSIQGGTTDEYYHLTSAQHTKATSTFTSSDNGLVPASGGGSSNFLRADGTWTTPSGAGTVTSVALSLPAMFTVSGSPITSSGTLTGSLANQTANTILAGPTSGGAAAPTFRTLVSADLPTMAVTQGGTGLTSCATGDILYGSATNTISKLASPASRKNQVLKCDTGSTPTWRELIEPAKFVTLTEHFANYTGPILVALNQSGAAYSGIDATASVPDGNHPGILKVTLNATTDYLVVSPSSATTVTMAFGVGYTLHECWFYLGQLSDGTNTFTIRSGFGNTVSTAAVTDGAYLSYTHGTNSGQWQYITTSNSVSTTSNSSTAAATGWNKLTVVCNAAGTSVEFFVNDVSLGTNTTNIPTGYARRTQPFWSFHQTVGTGNVYCVLDYWHYYQELP